MKCICLILLLVLFSDSLFAQQNEGTNFEDLTFKEALAKAKAVGKPLFIDCYTKTCVPCKYMVKFIFPLKKCGDYFNSHYVCIMKDMQEGEGVEIAQKYNVVVYPTYLIINPDGSLYCRIDGGAVSSPEEDFVQKVKDAIRLKEMNEKYNSGERGDSFVKEYIDFLLQHNTRRLQVVMGELLLGLSVPELCGERNWKLIKEQLNDINNPLFRYLFDHRKEFAEKLGQQEIEDKLVQLYADDFRIYKAMGFDHEKRVADLNILEEEGYKTAIPVKYKILCCWLIKKKKNDRLDEVVYILSKVNALPAENDRIAVVRELAGFEKIASMGQKKEACQYLKEIVRQCKTERNVDYVNGMIARLSQE